MMFPSCVLVSLHNVVASPRFSSFFLLPLLHLILQYHSVAPYVASLTCLSLNLILPPRFICWGRIIFSIY